MSAIPNIGISRSCFLAGTKYAVSCMPSGSKMYSFISSSMPRPAAFDHVREHVCRNAVAELRAGLERDRLFGEAAHHLVERNRAVAADLRRLVILRDLTTGNEFVRESGAVRQQILDGDRPLRLRDLPLADSTVIRAKRLSNCGSMSYSRSLPCSIRINAITDVIGFVIE